MVNWTDLYATMAPQYLPRTDPLSMLNLMAMAQPGIQMNPALMGAMATPYGYAAIPTMAPTMPVQGMMPGPAVMAAPAVSGPMPSVSSPVMPATTAVAPSTNVVNLTG